MTLPNREPTMKRILLGIAPEAFAAVNVLLCRL